MEININAGANSSDSRQFWMLIMAAWSQSIADYTMPLYQQKKYILNSRPKDLKPEEEVFIVQQTKECFRDYKYLSYIN